MKKNGILTLLFACIPGAGQMYQGYMKRGLSLITMFCLFIIVGSATGLDALVVGCIVVYMYSFFDTFNLRAQIIAENAPADDYLVHIKLERQADAGLHDGQPQADGLGPHCPGRPGGLRERPSCGCSVDVIVALGSRTTLCSAPSI